MKIRPVVAESFHADRQTGRHDEVNSGFFKFCESAKKIIPCQERNTGFEARSAESSEGVWEEN